MSNHKNSKPQSAPDANVDATEEHVEETIYEGVIIDDEPQSNRLVSFLKRHKTWFVAGGAATAGFILHGFLGRPDDCAVEYDQEPEEIEYDDIESTPESE